MSDQPSEATILAQLDAWALEDEQARRILHMELLERELGQQRGSTNSKTKTKATTTTPHSSSRSPEKSKSQPRQHQELEEPEPEQTAVSLAMQLSLEGREAGLRQAMLEQARLEASFAAQQKRRRERERERELQLELQREAAVTARQEREREREREREAVRERDRFEAEVRYYNYARSERKEKERVERSEREVVRFDLKRVERERKEKEKERKTRQGHVGESVLDEVVNRVREEIEEEARLGRRRQSKLTRDQEAERLQAKAKIMWQQVKADVAEDSELERNPTWKDRPRLDHHHHHATSTGYLTLDWDLSTTTTARRVGDNETETAKGLPSMHRLRPDTRSAFPQVRFRDGDAETETETRRLRRWEDGRGRWAETEATFWEDDELEDSYRWSKVSTERWDGGIRQEEQGRDGYRRYREASRLGRGFI
jgi:hypothetical protein